MRSSPRRAGLPAVMTVANEIALDISLNVEAQNRDISIGVSKRRKYITMTVAKSTSPVEEYEGPYSVTPRLYYGDELATRGYLMRDNVIVNAIPVVQTTNIYGGQTVVIG